MPDLDEVYPDARPYARWWWFSGPIDPAHVRAQLDWVAASGFGGVELAFVYPQPDAPPGPEMMSTEWSASVAAARQYALSIGLGCDLTFGTLWPFGGSFVPEADASRTFRGPSAQRLGRSWEMPHRPPGRILDHLDPAALGRYAARMGEALRPALAGRPGALFCDSWEVEGPNLWTEGFGQTFRERFGYDVEPFMTELDRHPDARYDYRRHLADAVLDGFYRPFARVCRDLGGVARVQCHGSPTDLLAAYASADVPESEAVLFDPPFSRIAASAAAFAGRPIVSAEAFTCLYGWVPYPGPGPHQGSERLGDLRLCADALIANGVNFLVWHGMPYSPPGGGQRFYATVHVGPDAAFAADLPAFNAYLTDVCARMRRGRPAHDLGVYLPLEDAWMLGELPPGLRRPSAAQHWELHHAAHPLETRGRRPVWLSGDLLAGARFEDGRLHCGQLSVAALYVDVCWLDREAVANLRRLADEGLPLCVRRRPAVPGRTPAGGAEADLERLLTHPNVVGELSGLDVGAPFLAGRLLPEHVCRRHEDGLTVFLAHPASRAVTYPMRHGQADDAGPERRTVELSAPLAGSPGRCHAQTLTLDFPPGQALLLHVDRHGSAVVHRLPLPDA